MTGNLYKTEEGWRRFRARTGNGLVSRRAFMDHRPTARLATAAAKPRKHEREQADEALAVFQPTLRGRRRVVIDE